jgi:hypothetical protein
MNSNSLLITDETGNREPIFLERVGHELHEAKSSGHG